MNLVERCIFLLFQSECSVLWYTLGLINAELMTCMNALLYEDQISYQIIVLKCEG